MYEFCLEFFFNLQIVQNLNLKVVNLIFWLELVEVKCEIYYFNIS